VVAREAGRLAAKALGRDDPAPERELALRFGADGDDDPGRGRAQGVEGPNIAGSGAGASASAAVTGSWWLSTPMSGGSCEDGVDAGARGARLQPAGPGTGEVVGVVGARVD
jgi:hypothetical protein